MSVEKIGLPGAEMSGFSTLSPLRGPPELNDARLVGSVGPGANEMAMPSRRTSLEPSDVASSVVPLTPRNGMVTVYGVTRRRD